MLGFRRLFLAGAGSVVLAGSLPAQTPTPSPAQTSQPTAPAIEPQEPIRTLTEEVQLTVTALDGQGRLDQTVEVADILVLEDGVAQEIRSARQVPASVVLLLDTGGEVNTAKRLAVTREVARRLLTTLTTGDQISVIQFNSRIELLQDWTSDITALKAVLDTRLLSGKRARLLDGMRAAIEQFRRAPTANRHLVMITDGVQSDGERLDQQEVILRLMMANAAVHVISYTTVSRAATAHARKVTRRRDKSIVPDEAIDSLPPEHDWQPLRSMHEPGGVIADLDPERRKRIKDYEAAMRAAEIQLTALSQETGGQSWLPESFDEMIEDGAGVARLIDSQYIVTYKPRRSLAAARPGEVRKIDVASRRVGLQLVSRRHYTVAGNPDTTGQSRPRRVMN